MSNSVRKNLQTTATSPDATKKRVKKPNTSKKEVLVVEKPQQEVPIQPIKVPARVKAPDVDVKKAIQVIFEANPGPQEDFLASSEQEVLYGGPLASETLVVTDKGRKRIDEVSVGDKVLTPKGTFTDVVGIPFIGTEESYELTFSNGHKVVASANHKWSVGTGDWAKTAGAFRTKKTNELLNFKLTRGRNKYQLPVVSTFEYKEQDHYISPYIMGVLLADGCVTRSVQIFTADEQVVQRVQGELHEDYEAVFRQTVAYGIVKKSRKKGKGVLNDYKEELTRLGLFGHTAFTKKILNSYLYDSVENRHSLLQGLMDSDGTCRGPDQGRRSAEAKYTTVSKDLKTTFMSLAEGLGFNTSCHTETLTTGSTAYRITISGSSLNPFYLKRKADNYSSFPAGINKVMITDIKPVGIKHVRCITVADEDSLFVLDRNITTHNSAGGGKSFAMVADPVRYFNNPKANMLLVRRSTEELRELISVSKELYPKAVPGAKFLEREKTWIMPSGATLWMSYLDKDDDVSRYQGQAFNWVGFDELTQWASPYAWNYMRTRLRTSKGSNLPLIQRATSNPGGPGHCIPYGDVLTDKGWVDIKTVKVGDKVLTPCGGELVYKSVSSVIKEQYEGDMIIRDGRGLKMEFTSNHRLPQELQETHIRPYTDLPNQATIKRAGEKLKGSTTETFTVPPVSTRKLKTEQPDTLAYRDYVELMGWFISEGHTLDRDKEFGISQCKEPQRTEIQELLDRCKFSYRVSRTGFQVSSPKWWAYLKTQGKCRDKYIPRELLDSDLLDTLAQALMDGDGTWGVRGECGQYFTTSKQLSLDVQEMFVKLGYSVFASQRQRENRKGLSYTINFSLKKTWELDKNRNVDTKSFAGEVYCLEVPDTELFFVRQKGCVWLSGNSWCKKMFIDPGVHNEPFWATDHETGEKLVWPGSSTFARDNNLVGQPMLKRRFIPATLFDNPYLADDGMYEANLLSMPEHLRRQLLEGDWDIAEGAAFPEFNRKIHVVEPYDIPDNWTKFRAADYGYSSYTGILWFAVDPSDEKLIAYRELYVSKVLAEDLADMVLEAEYGEKIRYGVLDSSLWHKRGDTGPSIAERMIAKGCRWRPADRSAGSRVSGKNEVHRRLQVDPGTEEPRIVFFDNCKKTIEQLPTIPLDKRNAEDVDTHSEDHLYDALRYGLMSRPRSGHMDAPAQDIYTPSEEIFGY